MSDSPMTPSRPYIMRALYEWIVDNDNTPYLLVDAEQPSVEVPTQYVNDGQIVLNISPGAVIDLHIGNDAVFFNGRFAGVPTDVHVPVSAVIGIYARENGQGMVFEPEFPNENPEPPETEPPSPINPDRRPSLKVVK